MAENLPITDSLHAEDWAGEMGERWLANLDRFESMISPVGDALLRRAAYGPGERVIDVGCGGGATTRAIARAVLPGGSVLGLDISQRLVEEAARRARAEALGNASFLAADAATARPAGAPFDRLFSRFGSMFFADPPGAFANLASLVRPGGRADLSVWAPARENPWVAGVMEIMRRFVEIPRPAPGTPGPFALDDPAYLRGLLEGGGFREVQFELWQGHQLIGGAGADPAAAARFIFGAMSFGRLLEERPPAERDAAEQQIAALFAGHRTAVGIEMGATAWLVSAIR